MTKYVISIALAAAALIVPQSAFALALSYPDSHPMTSVQVMFGISKTNDDSPAEKNVFGLRGTYSDESRTHRVGLEFSLAYGRENDKVDRSFFFNSLGADYFYTLYVGLLPGDIEVSIRPGIYAYFASLQWDEYATDVVSARPSIGVDFSKGHFYLNLFAGFQYDALLTDSGKAGFAQQYDFKAADVPQNEFELIGGATLGVSFFDGFSIFVEPAVTAAFNPSAESSFTITPGASFSSEHIVVAAGWMIPVNKNARDNKVGGLTMAAGFVF